MAFELLEPSIQGDGWRKRIIRFSEHDSSITPIYRQPPSLTGACWLLLLGTERKLRRQKRLPFRIEVSAAQVRYSLKGIERWVAARLQK